MKKKSTSIIKRFLSSFLLVFAISLVAGAQTVLLDEHFDVPDYLPPEITTDGALNPNKAADGPCSKGMVQVNKNQFMQIDVSSCGLFIVNMKSTASARKVNIQYKKEGEANYTTAITGLDVTDAESFDFTDLIPDLVSNNPVSLIITPTSGNIQVHDVYVEAGDSKSTSAEITEFKIAGQIGDEEIQSTAGTIDIEVPLGTNLSSVVPESIVISNNATLSPVTSTARDFSNPVTYTVTAEDGVTTKTWTVNVAQVESSAKEITAFKLSEDQVGASIINSAAGTITVRMPESADISSLTPTVFVISEFATIDPGISTAQDFSEPVVYTVTAQDASTKEWTVSVIQVNTDFDFEKVIGFASMDGDGMTGPTTGGQGAPDTLFINSPADFNTLCESLYYRQRAFKNGTPQNGVTNLPLVILLKEGVYDGTQSLSTDGAKAFGNSMLDIAEQGNLTFIGESNVIFKIGINVKRSWNILIRNIHFQDYYDDGINIGYPETHHIWVDHCTIGSPAGLPANTEHPDGGIDIKDGASYVTVSWCVIQNSWKTSLVGHSDNNGSTDNGRLKVTYINNYFKNTNSRNPRVRFGEVHVLNNLFEDIGLYGIAAANSSSVLAESNFFLNSRWGMYADREKEDFKTVFGDNKDGVFTSKTGNIPASGLKQTGNDYDDSGLPLITAQINPDMLNPSGRSVKFDELNPESVFDAHDYYDYVPMTPSEVRDIVPQLAGADAVFFGIVPVELHSFTGTLSNNEVTLNWSTSNEQNTLNYEVERSDDGNRFSKIGTVNSVNSILENHYVFKDKFPLEGTSFYRLKQNDRDGNHSYSKVISINNNTKASLALYPNPATNKITVNHGEATGNAMISILTMQGQAVKTMNPTVNSKTSTIDIHSLSPGNYILIYQNGMESATMKFLKK